MRIEAWQELCEPEENQAACFPFVMDGEEAEGFVVRHKGRLHAYINRCPHAGTPLDWTPGRFFSPDNQWLVCQTHGAHFAPVGGDCVSGPCPRGLTPLPLQQAQSLCVPAVAHSA